MKHLGLYFIGLMLFSCAGAENKEKETVEVKESVPFKSIASNFETTDLLLPEGFTYTVLFQAETSMVTRADGKKFPSKGQHDTSVFIPDPDSPKTKGKVYISHETWTADDNLGDGGGATIFDIELIDGKWEITSDFNHVDFSTVGGTNTNCGGSLTPYGTILTCEETAYTYTDSIYYKGRGMRDTTWVNGRPIWQNMGYIVEVDPITRKAITKHYKMGRFVHEDALCTKDGKTVYLTDDEAPGAFYKFETVTPFDYSDGQLFAYKQSEDGETGTWITLPMDTNSLIAANDKAIELGASMFIQQEWVEEINGKLYISETGNDNFNWDESIAKGGSVPKYVKEKLATTDGYDDPFGRILEFDPATNKMRPYLEGGKFSNSDDVFSSPDCNTSVTIGDKTYLVISEDVIGYNRERVDANAEKRGWRYNELYFLDISIENPTVDDLLRFAVAPRGSETTGSIFLPDGSMILNIQHPNSSNPLPFNNSTTVLIQGFK